MNRPDESSEANLAWGLVGAAHAVERRMEAALEPLGLSLAKFGVLSRLAESGEPLPLGALAERLACVRSNVTQLIDRLEADKLVLRLDDPQDRRSIHAELTPEGRARQEAGASALRDAQREAFAHLPAWQRETLAGLVAALRKEP